MYSFDHHLQEQGPVLVEEEDPLLVQEQDPVLVHEDDPLPVQGESHEEVMAKLKKIETGKIRFF